MKLAVIPVYVILILFVAPFLFLKYSLPSSPLILFSLFNTIILVIIVGRFRPYTYEVDDVLPFFCGSDELGVHTHDDIMENRDEDDTMENSDKDDDRDDEYHGTDGYDEDDDDNDNGSDDDVDWEDEEGCDDDLQKRIDDFIAKTYSRWKEEKLRDKLSSG